MSGPMSKLRTAVATARGGVDATRLNRLAVQVADLEREQRRVSTQLAAFEERFADLESRVSDPTWQATDAERAEAASLIDEVRREHRQIRARISAATVFEERLRVVEANLHIDSATGRPLNP